MSKIFQYKIKLLDTKPLIWRRVQMYANRTFWDLHVVIRNAMDWSDEQKHHFKIVDSKNNEHMIKSYLDDYNDNKFPLSWNISIKKYFLNDGYKIYYIFGTDENYIHRIILEKSIYKKVNINYPICLAGKGITYEEDEITESSFGLKLRSLSKFKVDSVVLTEGMRALTEHKIKLLDSLYH